MRFDSLTIVIQVHMAANSPAKGFHQDPEMLEKPLRQMR
eukprot:CAMPEP_0119323470 /NCGR_PEP_ID=MMETSP1333-20130426/60798_1 /TAXON_ID=418940 /ORGANISM="Scyphosphaera apsteinii, Strain RCC1455" /LENGTH=38 /DNA_ID= /DNA_START= /DNA_END= /DNA_ORIENTATION=